MELRGICETAGRRVTLPSRSPELPRTWVEPTPFLPAPSPRVGPHYWTAHPGAAWLLGWAASRGRAGPPSAPRPTPHVRVGRVVHLSPGTGMARPSCWPLSVIFCFDFWNNCSLREDALWPISAFNLEANAEVDEVGEFPHIPAEEVGQRKGKGFEVGVGSTLKNEWTERTGVTWAG